MSSSALKTNAVQVGQSATPTNNMTWYQPNTPDGSIRLGRGNVDAITQDVLTIDANGDLITAGGILIPGQYAGSFSDGVVLDYVAGTARVIAGASDGVSFYNNGPASPAKLGGFDASGNLTVNNNVPVARMVQGTAQTTNGANTYGYTGIPSWCKRLTLVFSGVLNTGGTFINLGSGSYASSGYSTFETRTASNAVTTFASTVNNGWPIGSTTALSGSVIFTLVNSATNAWAISGGFYSSSASTMYTYGGFIALSGALDRIQIYGGSGLTNFTGGSVNIIYEG
jgi:hypothetical protein